MQLNSQVNSPYLPEAAQDTVLRLGIAPLADSAWLQTDADFASFHAHKSHVLTTSAPAVCLSLPDSITAQEQFAHFLLQNLRDHHSAIYVQNKSTLQHRPSGLTWSLDNLRLARSSLWIQEDICLLEPAGKDYIMTAASVCAPSNWKLEEKIGKTLDAIHAPVPGYEVELAARVNRLLAGIKPGKALLRYNWSLQAGNELLWRQDYTPATVNAQLYWRVERQSLLRIPGTNIIIFSIRIYLNSLVQLALIPGFQHNLQNILARLPATQMTYKGLLDKTLG